MARRRAIGGDSACVPPNFNQAMLSVWEDLWHAMPQTGKISVTVHKLLQQYREYCSVERVRSRHSLESPAALLPVSFAQAKDWLLKKQKAQNQAIETGMFECLLYTVYAYIYTVHILFTCIVYIVDLHIFFTSRYSQ